MIIQFLETKKWYRQERQWADVEALIIGLHKVPTNADDYCDRRTPDLAISMPTEKTQPMDVD